MERRFASLANLINTPAGSHRAVALHHLGRRDEGLELAAESLELARRWGAPGGISQALRVLGELEREDGLGHLQDAVDVAGDSVARLEHAKALVALGTSLRRARRSSSRRRKHWGPGLGTTEMRPSQIREIVRRDSRRPALAREERALR